MCKLVTMLSKDTVEHLLLLRFCELCSDARLFQVRKVTPPHPSSPTEPSEDERCSGGGGVEQEGLLLSGWNLSRGVAAAG